MGLPSMSGPPPTHSQASLPALPSHLQSDTHLTAHLASRYACSVECFETTHADGSLVFMSPFPFPDYHHKHSSRSIHIQPRQRGLMEENREAQWARPKTWLAELGRAWEAGAKTRRLSFCKKSSKATVEGRNCRLTIIITQWRIRFWKNDHTVTSSLLYSFILIYTTIDQIITVCFRFRYLDDHEISHYTHSIQSRSFL